MRREALLAIANNYKWLPYDYYYLYHSLIPEKVATFNIFDEGWEIGNISGDTGQNVSNNSTRRSTNYIKVIPNNTYHFYWVSFLQNSSIGVMFYDIAKNFINAIYFYNANYDFVIPTNAHFIRFRIYNSTWEASTIVAHDICINESNSNLNGIYIPYKPRNVKDLARLEWIEANGHVENQLVQNGNFVNSSGWYSGNTHFSVSNNASTVVCESLTTNYQFYQFIQGLNTTSLYMAIAYVKPSVNAYFYMRLGSLTNCTYQQFTANVEKPIVTFKRLSSSEIGSQGTEFNVYALQSSSGLSENDTYQVRNCQLIDLTHDYGVGFEPTSINDPRIQKRIAQGYKAFNKGKYVGTDLSGLVSRSFNIWNEEWELGTLSYQTGDNVNTTDRIRGKNYIEVIPNTIYYQNATSTKQIQVFYYDENKNYIGFENNFTYALNGLFTTPSNCHYIRFIVGASYGITYNNDICINVSSSMNGTYMPFATTNKWNFNNFTLTAENCTYTKNSNSITIVSSSESGRVLCTGLAYGKYTLSFYSNSARGFFAIYALGIVQEYVEGLNTITFDYNGTSPISFFANNTTITISNVMCNEGDTALPYIPYGYLYDLAMPYQGNGALNSHDKMTRTDTEWVFEKNDNIADMGSLNFQYLGNNAFAVDIANMKPVANDTIFNALCNNYSAVSYNTLVNNTSLICMSGYVSGRIYVRDTNYTDATAFKTAMSGVPLVYQLATPQTIRIPRKHLAWVDLGELNWEIFGAGGSNVFRANIGDKALTKNVYSSVFFNNLTATASNDLKDMEMFVSTGSTYIYVKVVSCSTTTELINKFTGTFFFYETADEVADIPFKFNVQKGGTLNAYKLKIPSEYQEVEYIESTGTQYIDSGYAYNDNSIDNGRVVVDYMPIQLAQNNFYEKRVGGSYNGSSRSLIVYGTPSLSTELRLGVGLSDFILKDTNDQKFHPQINTRYLLDLTAKSGVISGSINQTALTALYSGKNYSQLNYYIFGNNENGAIGGYGVFRLYNFKLYDNNTLVRDFVPCYRKSDNVIGLYDLVQEKFYTNQGTGTFAKGNDIESNIYDCETLPNVGVEFRCK